MKFFRFFLLLILFSPFCKLFGISHQYQMIDLGLQNYSESIPSRINNQGWITGYLSDNNKRYIFVIDHEKKIALREQFVSQNLIITNQNEIIGSGILGSGHFHDQVFLWTNPFDYFQWFNFYKLGTPSERIIVMDANDSRIILLTNENPLPIMSSSRIRKSYLWIYRSGKFYKISHPYLEAGLKINNNNQILGCFYVDYSIPFIKLTQLSLYDIQKNEIKELDLPTYAEGGDLNDLGEVTGTLRFYLEASHQESTNGGITTTIPVKSVGFLWKPSGELIVLDNCRPIAMNNNGQIIGTFIKGNNEPCIWENGNLYDLGELVNLVDDKGNAWDKIIEIIDINDAGWMIGIGKIGEKKHAFLLIPSSQN